MDRPPLSPTPVSASSIIRFYYKVPDSCLMEQLTSGQLQPQIPTARHNTIVPKT